MSLSKRGSFSGLIDVQHTLLLVPANQTSLWSLLTLPNQSETVSKEDIRRKMCPPNDKLSQIIQSVEKIQESGLMPEHGAAITKCPLNIAQTCFNLRENEVQSELMTQSKTIPLLTINLQL